MLLMLLKCKTRRHATPLADVEQAWARDVAAEPKRPPEDRSRITPAQISQCGQDRKPHS